MKASQKNRQARDLNVKNCVEKPDIAPVLDNVPEYPGLKTKLDSLILKLDALEKKQFSNSTVLNTLRRNWRQKTILACLELAPALIALGTRMESAAILMAAAVTKTSLTRLRHLDLHAKSQGLLALGRNYSQELLVYAITPELLDAMEETSDNFDAAMKAAQVGSKEQKQVTNDILDTLKEIDGVLDRIALIVDTLKATQPVFHAIFRNAFHVVHPASSVLSAYGYVVEGDTRCGIKKCHLKITAYQPLEDPPSVADKAIAGKPKMSIDPKDSDIPVKLTSRNGGFRFLNLPDGTYELTAFLAGWAEQRVTFYVNRGLRAKLFIRMERLGTEAA